MTKGQYMNTRQRMDRLVSDLNDQMADSFRQEVAWILDEMLDRIEALEKGTVKPEGPGYTSDPIT